MTRLNSAVRVEQCTDEAMSAYESFVFSQQIGEFDLAEEVREVSGANNVDRGISQ